MKKRNIPHSKGIKSRKSSLKIPRQHIPLKHPAAAAAEWTEVHINGKDVANILLTAQQKISVSTDQKCAIAEKIQKATNSYIQDWMLNKHSSPKEFAAWAQKISDAAQTLLTCLGSPTSQSWRGIPLETKYDLLIEGTYDWDANAIRQPSFGITDDLKRPLCAAMRNFLKVLVFFWHHTAFLDKIRVCQIMRGKSS